MEYLVLASLDQPYYVIGWDYYVWFVCSAILSFAVSLLIGKRCNLSKSALGIPNLCVCIAASALLSILLATIVASVFGTWAAFV